LTKFFLVSSAAVSGFIGGQIAPLMFMGSGAGGILSHALSTVAPSLLAGHSINSLGVICGAALVGCNFNTVLFPAVLVAEMSRSLEPTLAVLLATTIAKVIVG
jgi:H+/Cl- antiporter ClcA